MKPKALVFYTYLPPWRIDIFNEMAKHYDLTIVFLHANAKGFTYNKEKLKDKLININVIFWEKGFVFKDKAFRFGIIYLLKKYKPEVVFTHEYFPASIVLAMLLKLKLFSYKLIITTSDNLKIAQNVNFLKKMFRKFVLRLSYGIIVYSEDVKKFYRKHFNHLKIEVCPNIQNPESLLEHVADFPALIGNYKKEFNLKEKVILFVGRLEYVKGIDLLINAFCDNSFKEYKLVIVGDGSQKELLKKMAIKTGINERIIFPGSFESSNLYVWYRIADFLVIPSRYEPFGAVVNEALVFGCPVLASKNIGALEFIKDGENGFIFNPEDIIEFKYMMQKMKSLESSIKINLMIKDFESYTNVFKKILDEH